MKARQSEPILGSGLRIERRKGKRKVPKAIPAVAGFRVTRKFRAICLADLAYHYFLPKVGKDDLPHFAAMIYTVAKSGDRPFLKLFFHYLDGYLKNKPPRFVLSENDKKLVTLFYRKPHLSAKEALKELGWEEEATGYYGKTKQRALARSRSMMRILSQCTWSIRG